MDYFQYMDIGTRIRGCEILTRIVDSGKSENTKMAIGGSNSQIDEKERLQ